MTKKKKYFSTETWRRTINPRKFKNLRRIEKIILRLQLHFYTSNILIVSHLNFNSCFLSKFDDFFHLKIGPESSHRLLFQTQSQTNSRHGPFAEWTDLEKKNEILNVNDINCQWVIKPRNYSNLNQHNISTLELTFALVTTAAK